ncbi:hypothetical protein Q7C36_014851 [Tachysurus vachellii]|uniref:Uncharacterized protein n=1 Tax=Tachysurus vachellii TaxID=175792 RepID=A0AA88SI40_TACVA|nr:hypothetical protein Q7C36_014851 [Tachysurus vachellii]
MERDCRTVKQDENSGGAEQKKISPKQSRFVFVLFFCAGLQIPESCRTSDGDREGARDRLGGVAKETDISGHGKRKEREAGALQQALS